MKSFRASLIVVAAASTAAGQTAQQRPGAGANGANREEPQTANQALQTGGGSLLRASLPQGDPNRSRLQNSNFYYVPTPEPRVLKKHDLVTIIVREETSFSSEGKTDLSKEAKLAAEIKDFIRLSLDNGGIVGGVTGTTPPKIDVTASGEFQGDGKIDRTDRFTARIQAEVVDVKPNGTLVLQARKKIKTDEDEQQFILSGIARAEDVSADNSVLSSQLFDLELSKTHTGPVRDNTRRGWLPRLFNALNPF